MQFVPQADWVVIVEDGKISKQGTYLDLGEQGVDWHQYEIQHQVKEEESAPQVEEAAAPLIVLDIP